MRLLITTVPATINSRSTTVVTTTSGRGMLPERTRFATGELRSRSGTRAMGAWLQGRLFSSLTGLLLGSGLGRYRDFHKPCFSVKEQSPSTNLQHQKQQRLHSGELVCLGPLYSNLFRPSHAAAAVRYCGSSAVSRPCKAFVNKRSRGTYRDNDVVCRAAACQKDSA